MTQVSAPKEALILSSRSPALVTESMRERIATVSAVSNPCALVRLSICSIVVSFADIFSFSTRKRELKRRIFLRYIIAFRTFNGTTATKNSVTSGLFCKEIPTEITAPIRLGMTTCTTFR